jgi:predicted TPR repeat methyltransferase
LARGTLGQADAAVAAFRKARDLDPDDRRAAALHLIRLGALPPAAMPIDYMHALLDGYAPAFDKALTEGLSYRGPELLLGAVRAARPRTTFAAVLDLGCGTGLAGAAFRPFAGRLTGVDLSPVMLAQALGKALYDRLVEGEAFTFLHAEAPTGARYDLVAADVFVYFHHLAQFQPIADVLAPGGLFAQSAAHVRAALDAAKLKILSLAPASARVQ